MDGHAESHARMQAAACISLTASREPRDLQRLMQSGSPFIPMTFLTAELPPPLVQLTLGAGEGRTSCASSTWFEM